MSFVRPEARAALMKWREALAGGVVALLGLYWTLGSFGLLRWIGAVLLLVAGALIVAGVQRARFRTDGGGPGVVRVDEGQIAYFGPLDGGVVALSEVSRLAVDPSAYPPGWSLSQAGQPDLFIPFNAEGSEALFDVFAALPGLKTETLLTHMQRYRERPPPHTIVIWERAALRLH
ncbi:hypothetical protein [Pseudooceanicola aestuarii]|uniref:hypothetical protein n=1 Tax=Pseudooceanicola aestuarii TaxID=2697319 RepID=UPI0013D82B81|nr:hypothetical protein [Pseudooceanicola aestuarii]